MSDLPGLYFRVRENGALVFRVDAATAQGRLEMEPLAAVNLRSGEVKPQGERLLTDADRTAIRDWIQARQTVLDAREIGDIRRTVEQMNLVAHWAQNRASVVELDLVADDLLMAMHDLRAVLVRHLAARVPPGRPD